MTVHTVQYSAENDSWIVKRSGRFNAEFETKDDAIKRAKARAVVGDIVHIKSEKGYVAERHEREEWSPLVGFFAT